MFCTSLRSLWDGRIGIGVDVAVGVGADDVVGKGGGGPVGDVGTGCAIGLPNAEICRAFAKMSPLLGIR